MFYRLCKRFDKVRHKDLLEMLGNVEKFGKGIRIIQNL